jgi:hypothetical protein
MKKSVLDQIQKEGNISCCAVTALIPSTKEVDESNIHLALQQTITKYPRLSSISKENYFQNGKDYELDLFVGDIPYIWNIEKELEKQLNEPLLQSWKLLVYKDMLIDGKIKIYVLFTLDYRIGDCQSNAIIVQSFVNQLAQIMTEEKSKEKVITKEIFVEDEINMTELISKRALFSLSQIFNRFKSSREVYSTKPKELIHSTFDSCKSLRIVGRHADRIQQTLQCKNVELESFILMSFLTSFRHLVESTTTVDYNPVKEKFRHMFTFILPVAIMIAFCYHNGMDSWAWAPSLLVFLVGRKIVPNQMIRLDYLTFGYCANARPAQTNSIGNYFVPFLHFDYCLRDNDLFWNHVKRIQKIISDNNKNSPSLVKWFQFVPLFMSSPSISKKDVSGIIALINCDDDLVQDMQCATINGHPHNRALMNVTITNCKNSTTIILTYPSELFTFADMDLFRGQFQGTMIRSLTEDNLNLSHQVHK